MSLRLDIKRVYAESTVKVYSVDLHPTDPWVLYSLENGNISILKSEEKGFISTTLSISEAPVRSAKFIPRSQWIVASADNIFLQIVNYNTGHKVQKVHAHEECITCLAVHPVLSLVLSSSQDKMIKVWSTENWSCLETFDDHSGGVAYVSFNPKDINSFASASCDNTAKTWMINSQNPVWSIDHTEPVNCVGYFECGKSYLITGSGMPTVWDYQKRICIQKLGVHQQDVITFVGLHPELPIVITGSQEGNLLIWNATTFRLERTLNYCLGGVVAVGYRKGSRMIGIGYEKGIVVIEICRKLAIPSMDDKGNIIWAKDKIQTVNVNDGFEIIEGKVTSLLGKEIGVCDIYPESFKYSSDGRSVGVLGDGLYRIYNFPLWKSKKSGAGLQFVWSSDKEYAIMESTSMVKIFNKSFKVTKTLRPSFLVEHIFGGRLLSVCSAKTIGFYDWANGRLVYEYEMKAAVTNVYWSDSADMVATTNDLSLTIWKLNKKTLEPLSEINEAVRSADWVGDTFVYINSAWRFNCYVGGEVCSMYCPMYHLERPMHVLRHFPNQCRLYLFDSNRNVVGYPVVQELLEYKKLVVCGDLKAANDVLKSVPVTQHNSVAHFLESRGFLEEAHELTTDPEHKYRLAAQLGTLDIREVAAFHKYIGPSEIDIRYTIFLSYYVLNSLTISTATPEILEWRGLFL